MNDASASICGICGNTKADQKAETKKAVKTIMYYQHALTHSFVIIKRWS